MSLSAPFLVETTFLLFILFVQLITNNWPTLVSNFFLPHRYTYDFVKLTNPAQISSDDVFCQSWCLLLLISFLIKTSSIIEEACYCLENNLINYSNKINEKIKYQGALPKQLLIDSFKNFIPTEIWDRPKMGFSFPFAKWMGNSDYIKQVSSNSNNILQRNYKKFKEGKLHWSQMMNLIILNHRKVL